MKQYIMVEEDLVKRMDMEISLLNDEIVALKIENIQLKGALGYRVPENIPRHDREDVIGDYSQRLQRNVKNMERITDAMNRYIDAVKALTKCKQNTRSNPATDAQNTT